MDLTPYLDALRRDLAAAAAPAGPGVAQAADLLAGSLDVAARMCLLEAISDAAAEITTKLSRASVEVRLRGREAQLVVTENGAPPSPAQATSSPTEAAAESGDLARLTLRLPESLKEAVERAAAAEAISVNAWLVRAIAQVLSGAPPAPGMRTNAERGRGRLGRRVTGFAQA